MRLTLWLTFLCAAAGGSGPAALAQAVDAGRPANPPPDLIVHNARVTTQDPAARHAQAVATTGAWVTAVGPDADVLALRGPGTRVIDANGRRVVPGLNDSHLHATRQGRFYNAELRWTA